MEHSIASRGKLGGLRRRHAQVSEEIAFRLSWRAGADDVYFFHVCLSETESLPAAVLRQLKCPVADTCVVRPEKRSGKRDLIFCVTGQSIDSRCVSVRIVILVEG
jgi:hypothetical protein